MGPVTLILTDGRALAEAFDLEPEGDEMRRWRAAMQALAASPGVEGVVIADLRRETNAPVRAAYDAWQSNSDPTLVNRKANALAAALRDWIWQRRRTDLTGVRYLVLAGDDRVIPHYRLRVAPPHLEPTQGTWDTEAEYFREGAVGAGTTVGAALAADLTLVDDFYAVPALEIAADGTPRMPPPELAVGRLVERPDDMTAVIEAYLGRPEISLDRILLAGYDFMQDGLEAGEAALARVAPRGQRTRLMGPDWTADELYRALLSSRHDLFAFALHATHFYAETPNNGVLTAAQIAHADPDLAGTVAIGLACHAGLNVPGEAHARALDFPEAFARQGAAYVGSTGWAYGSGSRDGSVRYQEALMARFIELLVERQAGATVGDALMRAKHDYRATLDDPSAFDAKTLAATVLYGIPSQAVGVPVRQDGR